MRLEFTIPGPPKPWQRAIPFRKAGGRQRAVNRDDHREYLAHVKSCGSAALLFLPGGASKWPRNSRYDLTIALFFPNECTRDDDNCEKAIKDGLKGVLWKDDSWRYFRRIVKTMELDRARPRVELVVEVVS